MIPKFRAWAKEDNKTVWVEEPDDENPYENPELLK